MIRIVKATSADAPVLTPLAEKTFWESHGHSAPETDIRNFVAEKYNEDALRNELTDPANIFHFIYADEKLAGFSKIIFDQPIAAVPEQRITKLERIYILGEMLGQPLGHELLQFNIALAKKRQQQGMWLFVWQENKRALRFYERAGFVTVGNFFYKISETHSNPNFQMYLQF